MTSAPQIDAAPILGCTVSRDIQEFELLIDDMEDALGEAWGDLGFEEALAFLDQPEATPLESLVIALDDLDADDFPTVEKIVAKARDKSIGLILVASELDPLTLHRLMQSGIGAFLPYPVPNGELQTTLAKVSAPPPPQVASQATQVSPAFQTPMGPGPARIVAIHGLSGGAGATTLATNLAWELANREKDDGLRVALIDLDLQFGSVATYLDLPRRDAVYEMLSDLEHLDEDTLKQTLLVYQNRMHVLTAPADILPLDLVGPAEMDRLLDVAQAEFDLVVIDMPRTLVNWTETVLRRADLYLAMVELEMRSAQNTLRFLKTLKSEILPTERLRFVLNRAPKFTDLTGRGRIKRMAETLEIEITDLLPDGGRPVTEANEHGRTLAEMAPKNPLRREIVRIAKTLSPVSKSASNAA